MEYVVLPSSEGDYDDTDLEEEVFPGQNEDGAFDYYGDYNDQIPDDFEHAVEHVYGDRHVGDEYEHDGDDDEDSGDEEDYDDDDEEDDDDEDSNDDDNAPYDDAGMYDDDDAEAYDEQFSLESYQKKEGKPFRFFNCYVILKNSFSEYNPSPFEDSSSESSDEE
ncbi:prostatic spermine-binding protein-like [Papaver somniferum]|uniref:prostatic spermine-binding protein-like n=1 Tax=Papaver somniferum TaxID=3469 RepID=UPI000E6F9C39|nr:prostatic spermine-binding protein-like [Papaver somniferum]